MAFSVFWTNTTLCLIIALKYWCLSYWCLWMHDSFLYLSLCLYVCVCTYTYIDCICIHKYFFILQFICVYVCMYICDTYMDTCILIWFPAHNFCSSLYPFYLRSQWQKVLRKRGFRLGIQVKNTGFLFWYPRWQWSAIVCPSRGLTGFLAALCQRTAGILPL